MTDFCCFIGSDLAGAFTAYATFSLGTKASTSCFITLPPGPEPWPFKSFKEIPLSFAVAFAAGLANTLSPDWVDYAFFYAFGAELTYYGAFYSDLADEDAED